MNGQPGPQPDPALLELFQAEMDAHIPVLSEGLLALESGQTADDTFAVMMRAAHSIKGAARIVGIDAAVQLAHAMEDCFLAAKEGRIRLGGQAADVLLQGVDALQRICSPDAGGSLADSSFEALLAEIAAVGSAKPLTHGAARASAGRPGLDVDVAGKSSSRGATERVVLPANFDDTEAEALRARLLGGDRESPARVCLDFASVERLSAGALALLTSLKRETDERAATPGLTVSGVREPVALVLRVSGLEFETSDHN